MRISTRFDLRKKALAVFNVQMTEDTCVTCDGTEYVTIKGTQFTCPNCRGRGASREMDLCVIEVKITAIDVCIHADRRRSEHYHVSLDNSNNNSFSMRQNELFRTLDDAMVYMNEVIKARDARGDGRYEHNIDATRIENIAQNAIKYRESQMPGHQPVSAETEEVF